MRNGRQLAFGMVVAGLALAGCLLDPSGLCADDAQCPARTHCEGNVCVRNAGAPGGSPGPTGGSVLAGGRSRTSYVSKAYPITGRFANATAAAVDSSDRLLVADAQNIYRVDKGVATQLVSTYDAAPVLDMPGYDITIVDLDVSGTSVYWLVKANGDLAVLRTDAPNGAIVVARVPSTSGAAVAVDGGSVFVLAGGVLSRVQGSTSTPVYLASDLFPFAACGVHGLAASSGRLYVLPSCYGVPPVSISTSGGTPQPLTGLADKGVLASVARSAAGGVLIPASGALYAVSSGGGVTKLVIGAAAELFLLQDALAVSGRAGHIFLVAGSTVLSLE